MKMLIVCCLLLFGLLLSLVVWVDGLVCVECFDGVVIVSGYVLVIQVGIDILVQGGNVFDVVVVVLFMLVVVELISFGLGGGGFFLLYDVVIGKDVMLDVCEIVLVVVMLQVFFDKQGNFDCDCLVNGVWLVGILGLFVVLVELLVRYGKLLLLVLLQLVICIVCEGFLVYECMVKGYVLCCEVMECYFGMCEVYLCNGKLIVSGDLFKQLELVQMLECLVVGGFDGFYKGQIGKLLLVGVRQVGGRWIVEELVGYCVKQCELIVFNYNGWKIIIVLLLLFGGIVLVSMLQILEGWDIRKMDLVYCIYLVVELMCCVYCDCMFFFGDLDFVQILQKVLISKDYVQGLCVIIYLEKVMFSDLLLGNLMLLEDDEIMYFLIIDCDGNCVGVIQIVNLLYGLGFIFKGIGVLLNNEMDDFVLKLGMFNVFGVMGYEVNVLKLGKCMFSLMMLIFMENSDKVIVLGILGGSCIIIMVLLGIFGYDVGLDVQQVVVLLCYYYQWLLDLIEVEDDVFDVVMVKQLQVMGYRIDLLGNVVVGGCGFSYVWGNLQIVEWDCKVNKLFGGSDLCNLVGSVQVVLVY